VPGLVADRRRNYRYVCGFDGKCLSAPAARLLSFLLITTRPRPVSSCYVAGYGLQRFRFPPVTPGNDLNP
jgi:hypothetical protein